VWCEDSIKYLNAAPEDSLPRYRRSGSENFAWLQIVCACLRMRLSGLAAAVRIIDRLSGAAEKFEREFGRRPHGASASTADWRL
jgi:hypothetical protein